MNLQKKSFNEEERKIFFSVLKEISKNSRFHECNNYIQHGNTTVKRHCIRVAATAYYIALKAGIKVNERELIRGALLHDYFLYDWHDSNNGHPVPGITHPRTALNNASQDYCLTDVEKDIILHHMFPLTLIPPRHKEAWIVCLADKICATKETAEPYLKNMKGYA